MKDNTKMPGHIGDFGLACALLALGYKIVSIDCLDSDFRHKTFIFDVEFQEDAFGADVEAYYRRELKVDPFDYYSRQRELKTRIYN